MKISAKIVKSYGENDKLKAIATVCLGGQFLVTGVRVVEGRKGLAVFVPSVRVKEEYRDICFPITPDCKNRFEEAVLYAYEMHQREQADKARDAEAENAGA